MTNDNPTQAEHIGNIIADLSDWLSIEDPSWQRILDRVSSIIRKDRERQSATIKEQVERIKGLEEALAGCLSVAPDDPIITSDNAERFRLLTIQLAELKEINEGLQDQYGSCELCEDTTEAGVVCVTCSNLAWKHVEELKAEVSTLAEQVRVMREAGQKFIDSMNSMQREKCDVALRMMTDAIALPLSHHTERVEGMEAVVDAAKHSVKLLGRPVDRDCQWQTAYILGNALNNLKKIEGDGDYGRT